MLSLLPLLLLSYLGTAAGFEVDENGYVTFCPCMGRFGNQADHYLGALGFAKGINRTLLLPPWVEYRSGEAKSLQVPFKTYFSVSKLSEFHRVLPLEDFMSSEIGQSLWPTSKRISFCYAYRNGAQQESCNAKDGNPFGPFWNTFDISFVSSKAYGPLHYDVHHTDVAASWKEKYTAEVWPVLAFTGAPAAFPVQKENIAIQEYLVWNEEMENKAKEFIKEKLPKGPFIGMHLRNGADWSRACEFISTAPTLFASAQCVGYRGEHGTLTDAMCQPSEEVIVKQLRRAINTHKATSVFIASDHDHMTRTLATKYFKRSEVTFHKLDAGSAEPHLDLAILAKSNFFIGNCVSSFSAFVKREREVDGLSSGFWAFPPDKRARHDPGEL